MSEMQAEWLARTQATVARLHHDLPSVDSADLPPVLEQFINAIDAAPDPLHTAVLSLLLMNTCTQIVQSLHDRDQAVACSCHTLTWSHLNRLTKWNENDPRLSFRHWTAAFVAQFDRAHPATPATRAAALVRADPVRAWTLKELARETQSSRLRLRQEFLNRYRLRPAAYLQLVRVCRAVALLRTATKVEVVALEVGYRSKKDLYAALKRWVGLTPTALRALSSSESMWLERELRIRCVNGIFASPAPGDRRESLPRTPRPRLAPLPHT
jgi:AraC-like DNA-binding protein